MDLKGGPFPLRVSANGRYLVGQNGRPFMLYGNTPWSMVVQLAVAQIDACLNALVAQGFNAILFNALEHLFSSQTPAYQSVGGHNPFASMTDFGSAKTESYWTVVDHIVNGCKARGMVCIINPAYLGFGGGDEGWMVEVTAESAGDLQAYGVFLANRYTQGNVIWCLGGDYPGDDTERAKQWNIVTGIRSVRTTDLITGHAARADSDAFAYWGGGSYTGFNLNSVYTAANGATAEYGECATAYARSGPVPAFFIEGWYENENSATNLQLVRQMVVPVLAGCLAGIFFGNSPMWGLGEPVANGGLGPQDAFDNHLNSTGAGCIAHVRTLFDAYSWHLLEPKIDTSLVTTALGTGESHIAPAKASDGSFAMVWTPNVNFTVDMSVFTPASVRGRWYDPTAGTYANASGTPFANSGTQAFTAPGNRALVLDENP